MHFVSNPYHFFPLFPFFLIAPALTGEIVTDGKVSFDKAALELEGVFASRDEEVAQLQKAIDLKKDAAAETGKANALHEGMFLTCQNLSFLHDHLFLVILLQYPL